jgi:hypothetical protein
MDFKRIFKYFQFWPSSQSFLSLGAAVIYFKIVAPYLTSALININKEKGKNTQAIAMRDSYQPYDANLCPPK